jgi:seryl-tRNA synthetase
MLDRRFILDNLDAVRRNAQDRHMTVDIDEFVRLESQWRSHQAELDELNRQVKELAGTKGKPSPEAIARGRELRGRRGEVEKETRETEQLLLQTQSAIPNMTHPSTPVGATDEANVEIARGRTPLPTFDFQPLDHVDLGERLGLLDLEAGSRVAGHGFYYLKGDGVMLDLALQQYTMAKLAHEGFEPHTTPDLARTSLSAATGYNPRGEETQIYSVDGTDLSLIATAEITLAGIHADAILEESDLPILMAGLSHCFRTEAGAHGRATRGLYRVHQFTKVEMFVVAHPDSSAEIHERLLTIEQAIFDELGIPYRVVENATGDLGAAAYRKFDVEAWMPGRGQGGSYGEVTSTSNCTDYQARRLNTRFRGRENRKPEFAHTLNGTAVATGRALVAILENYQNADGSVTVPEVLRPFVGKSTIKR